MSIAPLESPVVPPVYWMTATSSIPIATVGGAAADAFKILRKAWTLGSGFQCAVIGGSMRFSFSGASRLSGNRKYSAISAMTYSRTGSRSRIARNFCTHSQSLVIATSQAASFH